MSRARSQFTQKASDLNGILAVAQMKTLSVLGSTGSIGTNTLDVVRRNRHLYEVYSLAAGANVALLVDQILEFHPRFAAVANEALLGELSAALAESPLP